MTVCCFRLYLPAHLIVYHLWLLIFVRLILSKQYQYHRADQKYHPMLRHENGQFWQSLDKPQLNQPLVPL